MDGINDFQKMTDDEFLNELIECATTYTGYVRSLALEAISRLASMQGQIDACHKILGYDDWK